MVTHSNDGEFDTDPRLVKVPSRSFPPGSQRPIYFSPESYPRYVGVERQVPEYFPNNTATASDEDTTADPFLPLGSIPQTVTRTFAYLEDTYGAINEKKVAVGESTCSGVFGARPLGSPNGTALLSIDQLTQIAMERASSARQAIKIMGELAETYGFYGAGEFEGTAESLGVTDPEEAWIFHILPDPSGTSAIWVAQRMPEDSFAVLANMFVIREVDPNDTENFLLSSSVHAVAIEYGWWSNESSHLLDFTKIYSDGEYAHKYYSGRRMWGGYRLAGRDFPDTYKDLQSDPVYPVYTTPAYPISELDLFRFHRYYYQGTQYDMGAVGNLAGGPFGSPDRWKEGPGEAKIGGNWERSIGLYRTSDTYVAKSKREWDSGVLYFGPAAAMGTLFTPFLVSMRDIPSSFRSGHQAVFSRNSAFWASTYVQNLANLKWSYAIKDIEEMQHNLESASVSMVEELERRLAEGTIDRKAQELVYWSNAEAMLQSLWLLADKIMFKYASGFVNEPTPGGMSQMVGYPAWWLEAVGYADGPPPPPTEPKCCHPPKPNNAHDSEGGVHSEEYLTGKAAMREYLKATTRA